MRINAAARTYLWALGLLWLLPILVFLVGYAVLDKDVHGASCEGIGFGCSLSDADSLALLMGLFVAPVAAPAGLIAVAAIAFVRHRRRPRP